MSDELVKVGVTTNTTSSAGDTQYYGVGVASINSDQLDTYGSEKIVLIDTEGEGVISGEFPSWHARSGETGYYTSRSIVKSLDLLGEGEIEGIVSGEWVPDDETAKEGQIGWTGVKFQPLASQNPEAFLRSVYLNDTPIVNANGYYNFQSAEIAIANGTPSGITATDNFLSVGETSVLEKTRRINERLYGPDIDDEDQNEFYFYPKVYRFLNKDLENVRVNIKVPALSYTKITNDPNLEPDSSGEVPTWGTDEVGQVRGSRLTFKYRYRPIYKDKSGNLDLGISREWYGVGGDGDSRRIPYTSQIQGIIRSSYLHPFTVQLDPSLREPADNKYQLAGWEIEVTRSTLESIESHIVNQSYIDSVTELYSSTLCYPNSAISAMNFSAEYFSSIPNRSYDLRLLKVKVPGGDGGYDPITRQYNDQPWGGTFQDEKKWTDNPAWIFYDLITNKRYGVGKYLEGTTIDKWTLYEISKFCDTLVSNGEKGFEPRFTCNVLINTREEAFKVLKDFASCFRAMMYQGAGGIQTAMDKPRDPIAQFNNDNVIDGNFTYASVSRKAIPTVCLVRYNDKNNFYKPALEYVENSEAIRKYGVREKEVTAFACTSRSQALRLGRWILSTEVEQTETLTFNTGPEAMLIRPGDVVRVTDSNRATGKYMGRTITASTDSILIDKTIPELHETNNNKNYSVCLTTPSYFYDESIVNVTGQPDFAAFRKSHVQSFDFSPSNSSITLSKVAISGSTEASGTKINCSSDMFSTAGRDIVNQSTWSLTQLDDKSNNLYSVVSTRENDDLTFGVEAIAHNTGKFEYIESGILYSYVKTPQGVTASPPAPHSISLVSGSHPDSPYGYTKRIQVTINPCNGAAGSCDKGTTVGYKIYAKLGSSWSASEMVGSTSVPKSEFLKETIYLSDNTDSNGNPQTYYLPSANGTYSFRVFSINTIGAYSAGYEGASKTISNHYPVKDIKIHSLRLANKYFFNEVEEQTIEKDFFKSNDDKDAEVQWNAKFLNESSFSLPISYKVSIHEPSDISVLPGTELKSYTTPNTIFNFSFDKNKNLPNGAGPRRRFDMVVQAIDSEGVSSSGQVLDNNGTTNFGWDIVEVMNPKPTGYHITPRLNSSTQVAYQKGCDLTWTDQFIDSDGFVHLDLLSNTFPDLAGGYAYVSRHPFSGADFDLEGKPYPPTVNLQNGEGVYRSSLKFGSGELYKTGEYEISETNFEAEGATFSSQDAKITFKPTLVGEFSPPYYMAVKFYDSFDKEIKDKGVNTTWKSGLLNNTNSNSSETGLYLAFARDTTGVGGDKITKTHCLTSGACGEYLGDPDQGGSTCASNTFSAEIFPTKYYSANQGGFKYWVRMNINGQWEGQGISHIKVLSQKDVHTLYNYKGFYEYSCRINEQAQDYDVGTHHGGYYDENDDWVPTSFDLGVQTVFFPYHTNSTSRCNFRMGKLNDDGSMDYSSVGDKNPGLKFGGGTTPTYGYPLYSVWGATLHDDLFQASDYLDNELSFAGIAKDYGDMVPDVWTDDEKDKIDSFNERGNVIAGKSRPLRGFRRFRVYFDDNNLPQPNSASGLASYAVVGANCWNGEYESWPADNQGGEAPSTGDLAGNILLAKDGYNVFPSSVMSYLYKGDLFENIPGVWNHHSAGFGQGFGGLVKTQKYFDIHLGRMIDDSYLNEGFFGVITTNDYGISSQLARLPAGYDQETELHDAVYDVYPFVTKSIASGGDGAGTWKEMY
jgi:hypothetical protein